MVQPALQRTAEAAVEDVKKLCLTLHESLSSHTDVPIERLEAMEEVLKYCVTNIRNSGKRKLTQLQVVRVVKRKHDHCAHEVTAELAKRKEEEQGAGCISVNNEGDKHVSINTIRKLLDFNTHIKIFILIF